MENVNEWECENCPVLVDEFTTYDYKTLVQRYYYCGNAFAMLDKEFFENSTPKTKTKCIIRLLNNKDYCFMTVITTIRPITYFKMLLKTLIMKLFRY